MDDASRKNNNSNSDFDESIKNEYNLLGFESKYKTELYKEEDLYPEMKNNEINIEPKQSNKKLSLDSTSISYSQELNNLSEKGQKKRSDSTKDDILSYNKGIFDIYDKQRKLSSPLCDYYIGFDKHLSKRFKSTVDLQNSSNYIKKEEFFSPENSINKLNNMNNEKKENKNSNNTEDENDTKNTKQKCYSKKLSFNNNLNNNYNNKLFMNNNINNYNNNYINNNLYFYNTNYTQNQIFNINYINLNNYPIMNNPINKRKMTYNSQSDYIGNYFNNILYQNNRIQTQPELNMIQLLNQPRLNPMLFSYNESQDNYSNPNTNNKNNSNAKTGKKHLDIRKGDWQCPKCSNLNFSFRVLCNRCKLPKPSDVEEKK